MIATDLLGRHYDRVALFYDLLDWPFERWRYRQLRPLWVDGLRGEVLEAGVGTGRNLPYYSREASVTGVDLSAGQLRRAARRARQALARVALLQADSTRLPFEAARFDACLSTFLFCVLPDDLQRAALTELRRVTRPGGLLRLVEYRWPDDPERARRMRRGAWIAEKVFRARFDRPTEAAIHDSRARVLKIQDYSGGAIRAYDLEA